jgi:hypothetical protein
MRYHPLGTVAVAAMLAACSGTQLQQAQTKLVADNAAVIAALPTVASDAALVASGLSTVVAQVALIPGVPAADVAKAQTLLALVKTDAAGIAATPAAPPVALVQHVDAMAAVLIPIMAAIPQAAPYVPLVQAAVALAPAAIAVGGIVVGDVTAARTALTSK